MSKRLELLIKQHKGRFKLKDYQQFFSNLHLKQLTYLDVASAEQVSNRIKEVFPPIELKCEWLYSSQSFYDSHLMMEIYNSSNKDDSCYIFDDNYPYCGMFKATTQSALSQGLIVAKNTFDRTCFLIDCDFGFSFTINYYNENDRDYPNEFDIQRKVVRD